MIEERLKTSSEILICKYEVFGKIEHTKSQAFLLNDMKNLIFIATVNAFNKMEIHRLDFIVTEFSAQEVKEYLMLSHAILCP